MFYSQAETQELVRRIVHKVTADPTQLEDLYQEAIVHLWKLQESCPHQTRSWYLQSCQHFVQDQLRAGRSVDSPKRRRQRVTLEAEASPGSMVIEDDGFREIIWSDDEVVSTACFHDLAEKLRNSANHAQFKVLQMLFDGFCVSEIARSFGVSHTAIRKTRRRLVALANRLGTSQAEGSLQRKIKLSLVIKPIRNTAARASALSCLLASELWMFIQAA